MSTTQLTLRDGYVIGAGKPRFIVLENGHQIYDVTFPWTMEDGLLEQNIEEAARHTLQNYRKEKEVYGYRKEFTLHYNTFANEDILMAIDRLLYFDSRGYTILFYPRSEQLGYSYIVQYTGEPIELGILKGGYNAIGNDLVVMKWETVDIVPEYNWLSGRDLFDVFEFDNMVFA